MRYVDAFNHFFPEGIWSRILEIPGTGADIGKRMRGIPCIYDLDERFRVMDQFEDYKQVLSLGMPPLETLAGPETTPELARIANDGLAELVDKWPDRFVGYLASLPMNAPDEAAAEAERVLGSGSACGLQVHSNINGAPLDEPRFFGVFEAAARHGRPVMLHPARTASFPDYSTEDRSEYEIWWTFGWPYETSVAMARLVFSQMMDRLPDLKVLAHHLGAMVPYFEGRVGPGWDQLGNRTSDRNLGELLGKLKKRPIEYFKDFYADTAVFGSRPATICGLNFYGVDKVLFASDSPFDPEKGPGYIRETIAILESLDLPSGDLEKICHGNAEKLFGLTPGR
ncbi:amidohydrolase family protein [Pelagibacterium sp.]|uniref:amidohydrolase family protein n=1 Tax=Pelagibacterium sp. TaxID=1967288 RepID=UPI003A9430F1